MNDLQFNYLTVPDIKTLNALQNHNNGETVYCEEDEQTYLWKDNKWINLKDITNPVGGLNMNLYDLNKSIITQLKPMSNKDISLKLKLFEELHKKNMNTHYMLLCKDYNYYTVFESDAAINMPTFGSAVCEIITSLGDVMSIENTSDKYAIEIWIRIKDEVYAFYLFPYDAGVVHYG